MRNDYRTLLMLVSIIVSLLTGVYIGKGDALEDTYTITLYEDGSFALLDHGERVGYGCLDGELCED